MTYKRCDSRYGGEDEDDDTRCILGAGHAGRHRGVEPWPDVAVSWPNENPPPRKPRTRKPPQQLEGQLSIYDALGET